MIMIHRKISKIDTPYSGQGFLGTGHTAAAVLGDNSFEQTDPFLLLMDDQLDLPGGPPVGGAHPHAGFETVTLVLEGTDHGWKTGSFEIMTAGKGIVHTEEITAKTKMRILQLWLVLPPDKRWAEPFFQELQLQNVPIQKTTSGEIRVYSGSSNGLTSPISNQTPVTIVDFTLANDALATQELLASYNGFIYVVEGTVQVGEKEIRKGQIAWFDKTSINEASVIEFKAGEHGVRFVLYAGEPQNAAVVSHGPFIGDTKEDIIRLYQEYRQGKMVHLNDLPPNRKVHYN